MGSPSRQNFSPTRRKNTGPAGTWISQPVDIKMFSSRGIDKQNEHEASSSKAISLQIQNTDSQLSSGIARLHSPRKPPGMPKSPKAEKSVASTKPRVPTFASKYSADAATTSPKFQAIASTSPKFSSSNQQMISAKQNNYSPSPDREGEGMSKLFSKLQGLKNKYKAIGEDLPEGPQRK